ncbi:hypothetical protein I4U23_031337 [Adineta vaga]|nr:hypothetical protein I4U23_031337 [Adineta vaga]
MNAYTKLSWKTIYHNDMGFARSIRYLQRFLRRTLNTWWKRLRSIYTFYYTIIILLLINASYWYFSNHPHTSESLSNFNIKRLQIVVGIQAEWSQMKTLVNASQHTWIPKLPYDIFYFVGTRHKVEIESSVNKNIISLPVIDNEYPPINKTFAIWSYFYEKHLWNYDYFVVVDADTYVNVEQLDLMLKQLTCRECYIGFPAVGELHERKQLGLVVPYCLGMGYMISRYTLLKFGPHINACRTSTVAPHSDTELGRCIYHYVQGLACTGTKSLFERVMYTVINSNKTIRVARNARKQLQIDFPESPPTRFFRAAMVHPLKKERFFYQFHRQMTLGLRPILPHIFTSNSCVANPVIQQELYPQKKLIPECPSPKIKQSFDLKSLNAFVITLSSHDEHMSQLHDAFYQHGISVKPFYAETGQSRSIRTNLTNGARGLRLTMTRFFQMALTKKFERVLVLEDDAIPHRNFGLYLQNLMHDDRCGGYMPDNESGGVLMLGATIWKSGWFAIDNLTRKEIGSCRNVGTKTYGSFAAMYHRTTFEPILTWLDTNINDPYDFVFAHLARLGYPVRIAIPNLVITDVTHPSLIGERNYSSFHDPFKRARIHRWELNDYMSSKLEGVGVKGVDMSSQIHTPQPEDGDF